MMKLDSTNVIAVITSSIGVITTVITESVPYQIIIGVLTVLGLLFNIIYTAWKWYRKAKADGKITEDEIDDLMEDLHDIKKDGEDHE